MWMLAGFEKLACFLGLGEPVEVGVVFAHELLEKLGLSFQQLVAEAIIYLLRW